jgi:ribosomal protein L3 glutamine methyltransferase
MQRLSHTRPGAGRRRAGSKRVAAPAQPTETVGTAIDRVARTLARARLHFGHGTDNARDEAAELVFFAAGLAHEDGSAVYGKALHSAELTRIGRLVRMRVERRVPLAYLTHRAFFAGLELYVDERVLIPRSPIAELIGNRFAPWARPRGVRRILDVGTGSGAIALACAKAFPRAAVDAVDISADALAVCRRNARRLGLDQRVKIRKSDHFAALPPCRYDIIVSNPPYVGREEMRVLPREYRHEPRSALASGSDGLDSVRAILRAAPRYLADDGILVVEVGNTEGALMRKFPRLPFIWPEIAMGGGGVFVLRADDLKEI